MKYIFYIFLFVNILLANETPAQFQKKHFTPEQITFIKNHPIVKVSNEFNWAPYDYNEEGEAKGYSVDYLRLLARKIGVTFEFKVDKWSKLVSKIKNKQLDIIHPLSINEKRKEFLIFTDVLFNNDFSIVTNDGNKNIKNIKDLDGKILSVAKGWNITKYMKKNFPKIIFKEYDSALTKLKAVAFGEADATIDAYMTINYLKQKHLLSNLKIVGQAKLPGFKSQLHAGVRKDWKIFTDILNITMKNISNDERINLNKKWIGTTNKRIDFTQKEMEFLETKKTINMCIDPDWYPYERITENKHTGMSFDYFEIFRNLIPIPIELVPTNTWSQTLEYAKSGKCDIISLAAETKKRSQYLNFTKPYLKLPLVIATKNDKPFVSNVNEILDFQIGVEKDYFYVDLLKEHYPNIKLVEVNSIEEGISKVASGELYGFIDSLPVIGHILQTQYFGNLKIAGKLEENFSIGVATNKESTILNDIFNKAINNLTTLDHQTILNKWVSVKYEKAFDYSLVYKILVFISILAIFFIYRHLLLKKQNQDLKESIGEFEMLINATIEAMFILENGKVIDLNEEGIKLFGYEKKEEVLGLSAYELIVKKDHALLTKNLKKDDVSPYEVEAIKKDGSIFPILIKGRNILRRNKKIRISAVLDLTQLKQKEKVISENSKMVALGEMIGNIAHQWRQPLSVISTAASGVKVQKEMQILKDDVFYDSMDAIVQNSNYLSKTIDDFSSFIKEDKEKRVFNLDTHIAKNLIILSGMFKLNDIEIILNSDKHIEIETFENELTQAFINIINNAKDVLNEKEPEDKLIFISTYSINNKSYISIKDNAGGISSDIINRIFEPYFTTKDKSQGTGLGLYMVRQIVVESIQGNIDVQNVEFNYNDKTYQGAEFIICI